MAIVKTNRDVLTLDMFEVPTATEPMPGALNFSLALRQLVLDAIKSSPLKIEEIALKMSTLIGVPVSEHTLHNWTAPSRDGKSWRFPLEYLPAFEVACETHALTAWLAGVRGCKVLVGKEALDAEIGKLERVKEEATKRVKQLKQAMGDME